MNQEKLAKWLKLIIFGVSVSVTSAALSHLVYKAAKLQEENQLTI